MTHKVQEDGIVAPEEERVILNYAAHAQREIADVVTSVRYATKKGGTHVHA